MTLVAWISTRSSARMLPWTSPPMIASRLITSPSTSPPFPTSTCRPARTVPYGPLDLHHALGRDVTHHAHPHSDDREAGFGFRCALPLFRENRHASSPV